MDYARYKQSFHNDDNWGFAVQIYEKQRKVQNELGKFF